MLFQGSDGGASVVFAPAGGGEFPRGANALSGGAPVPGAGGPVGGGASPAPAPLPQPAPSPAPAALPPPPYTTSSMQVNDIISFLLHGNYAKVPCDLTCVCPLQYNKQRNLRSFYLIVYNRRANCAQWGGTFLIYCRGIFHRNKLPLSDSHA